MRCQGSGGRCDPVHGFDPHQGESEQAQEAIGKEGKSGISDALNGRTKTHKAYGYVWYFKNEYQGK